MNYLVLQKGLIGWSVAEVGSEAEATHISRELVQKERDLAEQARAELAQTLSTLRQLRQAYEHERAQHAQAERERDALRRLCERLKREKVNWRAKALSQLRWSDHTREYRLTRAGWVERREIALCTIEDAPTAGIAIKRAEDEARADRGGAMVRALRRRDPLWIVEIEIPVL